MCGGRGEVSQVDEVLPRPGDDLPACPQCGGYGTVIPRPCPECDGDGRVRTRRTIKVRIPAGVEDGTHIQLAGEGEIGPGGGPPGDLFLEIVQRPHPIFERQGDDLHCTVTIPMVAAALGATLTVETLDGPEDVDIRPGTQSGQAIPLYGRGVAHLNESGRGDLLIHVTVETPTKLDEEQEEPAPQAGQAARRGGPAGQVRPRPAGLLLPAARCVQRPLRRAAAPAGAARLRPAGACRAGVTPARASPAGASADAPVFVAAGPRLASDRIVLSGPEGRHARHRTPAAAGERADVTDGAGPARRVRGHRGGRTA